MGIGCRDGECREYVKKPVKMSIAGTEGGSRLGRTPNPPNGGTEGCTFSRGNGAWLTDW